MHTSLPDTPLSAVHPEIFETRERPVKFDLLKQIRLVDEQAMLEALRAGKPRAAASDVASTEPIENGNPLLKAPNLLITPHMAWATIEARKRLMQMTADNIKAFQAGVPINLVN